jgi:hypothetical protein
VGVHLKLYDDEPTIFSSEPNRNISNHHQVYAILKETSEEFDNDNNPVINLLNLRRCAKHMKEGQTKATIAAREIVQLSAAAWETTKAVVNHGGVIPPDSTREVLMGYRYALHRQGRYLLQQRSKI